MSKRTRVFVAPDLHARRWRLHALAALLAAAGWAVPSNGRASDAHASPKAPAPAAAAAPVAATPAPAAVAPAAKPPAVPAKPAAATAEQGLAVVQSRLQAKFGGQRAEEAGAAGPVVRVVSRAAATPPAAATDSHRPVAKPVRAAAAAPAPGHAGGHAPHWSYEGEGGPGSWGQLHPEFSTCTVGKRQSPIDIRDGLKLSLDAVAFDYKPSGFRVRDNGHTIQVDVSQGNTIEVMGQRYELQQFHFHRPSEESIDGRRFDMVAHFVHKSLEGRLAVVAVLIERGAAQAQLQQVWNNLPLEKGDSVAARATLDLERLLPEQRGYYTYMGSLTTPPCTEGVLWMVMKQPVQASADQLGIFARLYPMNARPIQSAAGRLIKESN